MPRAAERPAGLHRPTVTQVRIVLALGLVALGLVAALAGFRYVEQQRTALAAREREQEKEALFDRVVEMVERPVSRHVQFEYTLWDELRDFARRPDSAWAEENVDAALATYGLAAAWVLDTAFRPVYMAADSRLAVPARLPVPESALRAVVGRAGERRFFVRAGGTVFGLTGAPIHGTNDAERRLPAAGGYFVAVAWDSGFLSELSLLTQTVVETTAVHADCGAGFVRDLPGWDMKPVARLRVDGGSSMLAIMESMARRETVLLLLFAGLLLGLLFLVLWRWVSRPVAAIAQGLSAGSAEPVAGLASEPTEFGRVARMVRDFFAQQAELARHRERLEELVRERTAQLEAVQQELVRKERLATLGQVAGSIAHELRNPLGAIRNAAYYLGIVLAGEPALRVQRHLELMNAEVERSDRIITSLLDFARGRTAQPAECRLADVLQRAVAEARLPGNVQAEQSVPADLPALRVDSEQTAQALRNLLVNAAQAMPGGGAVSVVAAVGGDCVRVRVTDSGPGVKPDDRVRLFEPLFSTKTFGVGLGLPIARAFIEASGGTVAFEPGPGPGATFLVTLPLAVRPRAQVPGEPA